MCGSLGDQNIDILGLFDGHNGDLVSKFVAKEIASIFKEFLIEKKQEPSAEIAKEVGV